MPAIASMSSAFKRARGRPRGGGRGHFIRVGANGRARSRTRRRQNLARWWRPVGLERRLARDRLRPTGPPSRLGRRRDWRRAPVPLDRGRLRQRHRSLLLGRPRARLVGSGVSGRDCCDRGDLPAAPAARLCSGARPFRDQRRVRRGDDQSHADRASYPPLSRLQRLGCWFRRAARRKPEVRPLRAAARAHRRQPHCRQAAAHPAFRPPRHGAAGRRLRRGEGAA